MAGGGDGHRPGYAGVRASGGQGRPRGAGVRAFGGGGRRVLRLAAPGTLPCRTSSPTFLVHQRPEGAAEHGDAAAGGDTAGEVEGGRRHPGGTRPRGRNCGEGGRAPPARKAGGARYSAVQGPVPGVPHPPALCSPQCWRRSELALLARCLGNSALHKAPARGSSPASACESARS